MKQCVSCAHERVEIVFGVFVKQCRQHPPEKLPPPNVEFSPSPLKESDGKVQK